MNNIKDDRTITITSSNNLLILNPDILISVTKVADTAFCSRKAYLSDKFKPVGQKKNKTLIFGNVIHEVIQSCLGDRNFDKDNLIKNLNKVLKLFIADIWECDLDYEEAYNECLNKLQNLDNFSKVYFNNVPHSDAVVSDPRAMINENPLLAIKDIYTFEEDIWSPKYGLKGKVDATIKGTIDFRSKGILEDVVMPLEIKTGRSTTGIEHRAQTMLYSIMMAERYSCDLQSGLLWYTTANSLIRVTPARNEIRGLLISRNNLSVYMTHREPSKFLRMLNNEDTNNDVNDIEDVILPPTVDNDHSCPRCFMVDSCMLFKRTLEGPVQPECEIHSLVQTKTSHLSERHLEFFRKWEELISIEETDIAKYKKQLWTLKGTERESKGLCLNQMKLIGNLPLNSSQPNNLLKYDQIYSFSKSENSLLNSNISIGDAITISIEEYDIIALATGFVLDMSSSTITIGLERPLNKGVLEYRKDFKLKSIYDQYYRIDKDELGTSMAMIRDSLGSLFYSGDKGYEKFRKLIVDFHTPLYGNENLDENDDDLKNLNDDQKKAIKKVINTQDYSLILGMPGTGKTTTIATAIKNIVKRGKSVLLASYTHSAVDTIVVKLKNLGFDILRLGQIDKVHPEVKNFASLINVNEISSLDELDKKIMLPPVVATTCLGINNPIFSKRKFDYCIVDEASQITLPVCLGPIKFSDKFILVGDHYQLPPLVRNENARRFGLDISLFKILCERQPESVVSLTYQYRMNKDIMLLSNELIYNNQLVCGSDNVANQKLAIPFKDKVNTYPDWIQKLLEPELKVTFINTDEIDAYEQQEGDSIQNIGEVKVIETLINALLDVGLHQSQIGLISFYRQQTKLLTNKLKNLNDLEILTADKSQGRDKDLIILSTCRSNQNCQVGDLLNDWRRINVSITRAKSKLIIVGCKKTLKSSTKFNKLINIIKDNGWVINLTDDNMNITKNNNDNLIKPLSKDKSNECIPTNKSDRDSHTTQNDQIKNKNLKRNRTSTLSQQSKTTSPLKENDQKRIKNND